MLVPLFIVFLLLLGFLSVDQLCLNDARRRLPIYPGAVLVEETHNGLRSRGIGNTLMVYRSSDGQEMIEAWYQEHQIELLKARRQLGMNNLSNWYAPDEQGSGTLIYYLSQCVL